MVMTSSRPQCWCQWVGCIGKSDVFLRDEGAAGGQDAYGSHGVVRSRWSRDRIQGWDSGRGWRSFCSRELWGLARRVSAALFNIETFYLCTRLPWNQDATPAIWTWTENTDGITCTINFVVNERPAPNLWSLVPTKMKLGGGCNERHAVCCFWLFRDDMKDQKTQNLRLCVYYQSFSAEHCVTSQLDTIKTYIVLQYSFSVSHQGTKYPLFSLKFRYWPPAVIMINTSACEVKWTTARQNFQNVSKRINLWIFMQY